MSSATRRAVVITGSSTGIGRAAALHLDELGFQVFAGVRKEIDGDSLREAASDRLEPLIVDVTDREQIGAAAVRVRDATGGRLAGLVNNAGIGAGGPLELLDIDDFRHALDVNLTGQVAVTQAFLPQLRAARGRIVFVSSIGGRMATPFMGPYHASKFGIEAIGDTLRQELRPFGMSVSIVEPGAVATPIWEKGAQTATEVREKIGSEGERLYGHAVARFVELAEETGGRGIPPERVAEVIAHALTAERPRTRYPIGMDARIQARVGRFLPDRVRDRLIARVTGL
jgi:NAD(P)-dependent dehydrogenase (short-subunit alcohol dehydrogenase family)